MSLFFNGEREIQTPKILV